MSTRGFSHSNSNRFHGALLNSGNFLQGKFDAALMINDFGGRPGSGNSELECTRALFLTNPVDDRSAVETSKEPLVAKACQWIYDQANFKSWLDDGIDSQLLWISGGSGRGKTMLSLFLINEMKKSAMHTQSGPAVLLFYFVDTRDQKRNTAVSILRGLIWLLLQARPRLMEYILSEFVVQRDNLFSQTSLEALWRIFSAMLKDPVTGKVYCIIDGLDECQEDTLQPLLRKVTNFFDNERNFMEQPRQGNLNPALAPIRMILVSQEVPKCLLDNLARFPRIQIEVAIMGMAKTKPPSAASKEWGDARLKTPTREHKTIKRTKLATVAILALQQQKLASLEAKHVSPTCDNNAVDSIRQEDPTSREREEEVEPRPANLPIAKTTTESLTQRHETAALAAEAKVTDPANLAADHLAQFTTVATDLTADEYFFDDVGDDDAAEEPGAFREIHSGQQTVEEAEEEKGDDGAIRNQALCHYIDAKVEELSQEKGYDDTIKEPVSYGLQAKGDGTFLWVDLAVEDLRFYEAQHAEQAVSQLPPSVNEMYCRTLRRIPKHMVPLVVDIFHWVIGARRPMSLLELATALMQVGSMANPLKMVQQGIAACSTMLTINEETTEVHIKHTSVQYLLMEKSGPLWSDAALYRFHVNVLDVDGEIASICLRYLEQGCLNDGPITMGDRACYRQRVEQFPLLPYAAIFWPDHLRSATHPNADLSSPFFARKSTIRKNWWQCYYPATTGKGTLQTPRDFTLLHMMAYLNLPYLAYQLEYRGELYPRLNKRDSFGSSPLCWAASLGNMEMLVFLLQRGASQECVGETIFELACRKGQEKIVQYLLDLGYGVNTRGVEQSLVQTLGQTTRWFHGVVSEGAILDIDYWKLFARDTGVGGTALHSACLCGHTSVVKLLVSRGAHVQTATDKGWTAIHSASWTGQMDCVKILLDHGADPQAVTHDGWNALHCAASRGKYPVVSFYLAYGIPVDVITTKRKTPLHLASYIGSTATIRILVGAGAFINAQSHKGETPLHLAARAGNPEAVETLLSLGAYKCMINNDGQTAAEALRGEIGSSAEQREALRILEQYHMPGYVPCKHKEDASLRAAGQQPRSQPASTQFSRTDSELPSPDSPPPPLPPRPHPPEKPAPETGLGIVYQPPQGQGESMPSSIHVSHIPRKPIPSSLGAVTAPKPPVVATPQPPIIPSPNTMITPPRNAQPSSNVPQAPQPPWNSHGMPESPPPTGRPAQPPTFQSPAHAGQPQAVSSTSHMHQTRPRIIAGQTQWQTTQFPAAPNPPLPTQPPPPPPPYNTASPPWTPPAPQPTPVSQIPPSSQLLTPPHQPPMCSNTPSQWTSPVPSYPAPAYNPGAYPPPPLHHQHPYPETPHQYPNPQAQPTVASGYLSVSGSLPGWPDRQQGGVGAGMDFARRPPPPWAGGPLPCCAGEERKKKVVSVWGFKISRK